MRVGLVGAGFMGGVHLNAYAAIPEVEVVGVADARTEAAVAGAKMVGARPYASFEELVAAEDVELVDVCLPTAFHRDLALLAAGEGKHVILEKPIARTMEDAREILEAFSDDGPRLFVGHVVRFFPDYVFVTLRFESGAIAHVEGHWGYPGPFNYSIEVAGSDALLTVDSTEPASLELVGDPDASGEMPDLASGESPYEVELAHFVDCIATGEESIVRPQDASEALRIGLAATESVLTGKPVTLGGRS